MTNTQPDWNDTAHKTHVRTTSWTDATGTTARYSVICDECGAVGQTQEYRDDAQAIADRHSNVGGFEPRGAWGERFEFEGEKYDPCIEGEEDWT